MRRTPVYQKEDFEILAHYFHDGSVNRISHQGNRLELDLNSAEILSEWNEWGMTLNEDKCLEGTLVITNIYKITENDVELDHCLENRDDGEIFQLVIAKKLVKLSVSWWDYPKEEIQPFSSFEIIAEQILWIDRLNNLELDLTGIDTHRKPDT